MTGFEPWISGVGIDRSTSCATTTANVVNKFYNGVHMLTDFSGTQRIEGTGESTGIMPHHIKTGADVINKF